METSVFTNYLSSLTMYSASSDRCEIGYNEFTQFQHLGAKIINAYQKGYFTHQEYRILTDLYYCIEKSIKQEVKTA